MGTQEYRANYQAAMQEANSQLAEIFREFENLNLRKEHLEDALGALEPFLNRTSAEPVRHEQEIPAPVHFQPEPVAPAPAAPVLVNEPVAPAPYAPLPEVITDPIQSRINRALGLAVA